MTVPVDLPITVALAGKFAQPTLAVLDEQIADFESANPDVRIEVVRAPKDPDDRREWVATQLDEGDTSIDVFLLDATWPAELAAGGGLAPLDDHLKAQGIETDAFLPATIQANSFDGRLFALPWTADGGLLYFRRDLLDRYGYKPPTTWTALQRIALDVKTKEGLPHGFVWHGAASESLTCSALEFIWDHGGDVLDKAGNVIFDSPRTRAALQQMNDLIQSGASPQDVAEHDDWKALTAFQNGDAVFMRNWYDAWEHLNSDASAVPDKVGVAALPASCLGGQSLALSTHSLHPEKALRLMAFLAGYDQQVQMALSANQPPVLEVAYSDANLLAKAPRFRQLHTAFSLARARPPLAEYALLSEAVYTQVNRMLAGRQDVETTAVNIQHGIESVPR